MRCLFCGKELALLKRLRGGGEFCSEAHRKEYQDQYEQLALARLLQAKPADAGVQSSFKPISEPERPAHQAMGGPPEPQIPPRPAAPAVAMIEAAPSPKPVAPPPAEADPAPLAGFLAAPVVPMVTAFQHAGAIELPPVTTPALPVAVADPESESALPPAAPLDLEPSLHALDQHIRPKERLELREFASPNPVIQVHSQPATGTAPSGEAETMEISMSPHPPQKANPWLGPPRPFAASLVQLGELARLDFTTIGFAYTDLGVSEDQVQTVDPPEVEESNPEVTVPEAAISSAPQDADVAIPRPVAPGAETIPTPEPAPPELVTKALPVTLHGLAAPRGKFAQPFTPMAPASDVRVPSSASLPLRPLIVLGPPPAAFPAVVAKHEARPPEPAKSQETPPASLRTSMIPQPENARIEQRVAPEVQPVKVEHSVAAQTKPNIEPSAQAPVKVLPVSDAAIPSLRLEATESVWSNLSAGLKIGMVVAVIAGIAGIGYLVTGVGNKPAVQTPVAAPNVSSVAAGVPISGGWIDDWANAAKSKRHISLLSGSAKLSDYRLEFQAQIESKAIGWVFRGLNPRNYYVAKLETVTPGLEPSVALVHFAVIDGQDENRVVIPLPMKSRVDTTYKIRFDAAGNHFTVWVQDQQIAEWSDSRFGSGGVGFFADRDEKAAMQGPVNVTALVPKN
jgi:hypothetical protein